MTSVTNIMNEQWKQDLESWWGEAQTPIEKSLAEQLRQANERIKELEDKLEIAKRSLRYEQQLRAGESWSYSK